MYSVAAPGIYLMEIGGEGETFSTWEEVAKVEQVFPY